ncbi:MAG: type II/IV secretion system ATPase subunit [DPANN group archaeon]|nr:type II/IV secretion system ATPase subunit [DPANN group archaeon]
MDKELEGYEITAAGLVARISIVDEGKFVPRYKVTFPQIGHATLMILDSVRDELIKQTTVKAKEILDPKIARIIQKRFADKAEELVSRYFPGIDTISKGELVGLLVNDMVGLGEIEVPLNDDALEEIVINNAAEPLWVYHKRYGWLVTNITLEDEEKIKDYANLIGRRVGRQINTLTPLMDAHMLEGDRVNSTLFPISTKGNTVTIRKFARKPWTVTDLIQLKTFNDEIAALLWLAMQYELNVLVSGGTGSGKTSALNVLMPFVQPNQRILSIEDTRELNLPSYQHWVPMTTRDPNPEGKGEVTMLDLMLNGLRMRPDRIVVGEIRKRAEAETLFEAMHTGHAVYSTLHADRAEQVKRRLTTQPIDISEALLESLHIVLVQYRHRRLGIRRTLELAEVVPVGAGGDEVTIDMRTLYRWKPRQDTIMREKPSVRLFGEIESLTGLLESEIKEDLEQKKSILKWMVNQNINDVDVVGTLMARYYRDPSDLIKLARINKPFTPEE